MHRPLHVCASLLVALSAGSAAGEVVSEEFAAKALDAEAWTFVDPLGDGRVGTGDGRLRITAPARVAHNLWSGGNNAPRLMRPVADEDFEIEVKFDSGVSAGFQMQGLVVEQDERRFMRAEFHHDGASARIYCAVIDADEVAIKVNRSLAGAAAPLYLKLARAGDVWTQLYSFDGEAWQTAAAFSHEMTVTGVGVFSGNYAIGNRPVPGHVAVIDYFKLR